MLVSCNELHSVVVEMPGPAISFCHRCSTVFLGAHGYLLFFHFCLFFWTGGGGGGSLVIVVVCYTKYHSNKRLDLYLNHGCVFANASLHCHSAFELREFSDFLLLFTAVD